MNVKGMHILIWWVKLMLNFFFHCAVAGDGESDCDSDCPTHRLLSVGISPKDIPTLYWFPLEDVRNLTIEGESCSLALEVPEPERRKWHAIHLDADFSQESGLRRSADVVQNQTKDHRSGTYYIDIPSLNFTSRLRCESEESITLQLYYEDPSLWAFNCKARPCVCLEKGGNCSHIQKKECDVVSFSSLAIPLDTSFRFQWRPEHLWSSISLFWGSKFLYIDFRDINSYDWPDFAIHSRIFVNDAEGTWTCECLINVPGLLLQHDCSHFGYLNETTMMMLYVGSPTLFSLGCGPKEEPEDARLSGYQIAIVAVATVVLIALIALIVIRFKGHASDDK